MGVINNHIEYINELSQSNPQALVARAELRYRNIINNIAEKALDNTGREIIMLAGPSSSGKTTTANKIRQTFTSLGMDTHVISLDDFYLNREDIPGYAEGKPDFETVYALDLPLITSTLKSLMAGETTDMPAFDFTVGKRKQKYTKLKLDSNDAIIVEGLHALNPIVTSDLEMLRMMKIYINVSSRIYDLKGKIILNKRNLRFVRRLIRDFNFRGSSPNNTFRLWKGVCEGEEKYLFPYRDFADVRINSIHLCEPCIFRDRAIELLTDCEIDEEYQADAKRLVNSLKKFNTVDSTLIPKDSLLREFIG
jgi:uridine kinase